MEEECGRLKKCRDILWSGLSYVPFNESLMVKAIRLEEKMGDLRAARSVLAKLKNVDFSKSWRVILEGASLEARAGNKEIARKIFKVSDRY
jgi:hypothetical protein